MAAQMTRLAPFANKLFGTALRFGSVRLSSGHSHAAPVDHQKGKVASDQASMPDTLGHAVGPERWELLARQAGNEDPFEMNIKERTKGTHDDPTLIPSMYDKRLIGCVCEEDAIAIQWMFLHKGEPKRCSCGNWFKLVELNTSQYGAKHH